MPTPPFDTSYRQPPLDLARPATVSRALFEPRTASYQGPPCGTGLAEVHPVERGRRLLVGQTQHSEGVAETDQGGEKWHHQGDLQREVAGVVVDGYDLCLHRRWLAGDLLRKLGVAHDLGVILESCRYLLFLRRWDDLAALGPLGEADRQCREHEAPCHGETEGESEGPSGRVHAGGLADPLLLDGCERVVVELRYQQPQTTARDGERNHKVPTAVHARDERDDDPDSDAGQQEPRPDDRGRTRVTGSFAGHHCRREHGQRQWRQ